MDRYVEPLFEKLRSRKWTLAVAESCTGGMIAARLTDVAGASDVFERGFVTYANAAKIEMLGVPAHLIEAHGAVSKETAEAMAKGALSKSHAELAIAVTGIAGPAGGTTEKPVGLVYIAVATWDGADVREHRFSGDRATVRAQAAANALAHALEVMS